MSSLFIDTSNKVTFGILDGNFEWIHFHSSSDTKASKILHSLIQESLEDHGLELNSLDCLFYITGPGSYTGVRVAQGFAEILEWQGIEAYSCRHFDIPGILGDDAGVFVSKAFKQETFVYTWKGKENEKKLISETEADVLLKELSAQGRTCYTSERDFYKECRSTYDLIEKEPGVLFSVLRKLGKKSEVFYYRDLEEEFTKGK